MDKKIRGEKSLLLISKITLRLAFTNLIGSVRCNPCAEVIKATKLRIAPKSAAKIRHFSDPSKSLHKKNTHAITAEVLRITKMIKQVLVVSVKNKLIQ